MSLRPRLTRMWFTYAVSAVLLVLALVVATGGATLAAQGPPSPPPGLSRGPKAIEVLGARLPTVAAAYGLQAMELRELFLSDPTLHVDNGDELLYVDLPFPGDVAASQADLAASEAAPFPLEDTFALHSLPGADHTIYLDFDGHTTTGTTWNSSYGVSTIVSPPYDIDGNPGSFSTTELERIQTVWQIVAEDFAPYDVNVTTQDPGADALRDTGGGDTQWGTRVVITDDTFANCGCGGHAYIGSFDDYTDEPVFVYNSSLVGVSEASTHEVGHALNLSHDGTSSATYYTGHGSGETGWAPLMGASYYQPVTQWSMGEYYDCNNAGPSANYGNGPDDLAVIASLTNGNGFGYRPDDHGDSRLAATPLAVNGSALSGAGVIEQTGDVDVFSFATGGGQVSLSIAGAPSRPNLDVLATLYDGSDNVVATSDPAATLAAPLNVTLEAGTYYLYVDGTGTGTPLASSPTGYTEYGSLGQYTISGTALVSDNDPPVAAFTHGVADLTATFTDGSTDLDGWIASWDWDFGDGNSSTEQHPVHTYAGGGTYAVRLTVTDNEGATDSASQSVTVTAPPTADFDASITYLNVEFTDSSTDDDGSIASWDWDFGDGNGSTAQNPTHDYAAGGTYTVLLTVWDNDGMSDTTSQDVTVTEPPPYVDHAATGEVPAAGVVSGSYLDTQANGGAAQSITEVESGGKPSRRHSLLEHTWTLVVPAGGTAATVHANAWAPVSGDGDTFAFSYSTDGVSYTPMFAVAATSDDDSYQTYDLSGVSGTVYIQVLDTDRTEGQNVPDTVYVDHLFIRADHTLVAPPVAPSGLTATAVSSSAIDLAWSDNADNEVGFTVERSPGGAGQWAPIASLGMDATLYSDTGLSANTAYDYRVQAYNSADVSAYSNTAGDTTHSARWMVVSSLAPSAATVRNKWNATVTITVTEPDGTPVIGALVTGVWSDGATGSSDCTTVAGGVCSVTQNSIKTQVPSVLWTVSAVTHDTYTYDPGPSVTSVTVTQ